MDRTSTSPHTLDDYLRAIKRRRLLVIAITLAATAIGLLWSFTRPEVYRASTKVIIDVRSSALLFGTSAQSTADAKRILLDEVALLSGVDVRARAQDALALPSPPPRPTVTTDSASDVVTLTVEDESAARAARLANEYVKQYNDLKTERAEDESAGTTENLQRRIADLGNQIDSLSAAVAASAIDDDSALNAQLADLIGQQSRLESDLSKLQLDASRLGSAAQVTHSAAPPQRPVGPGVLRVVGLSLIIGAAFGVVLALVLQRRRSVITHPGDLHLLGSAPDLLAAVPIAPAGSAAPLAGEDPAHPAVEAHRRLRNSVQFAAAKHGLKVLQVTSPVEGEGKTTTAANLAVVLANAGSKVVLVDADLRHPSAHEAFGLGIESGLVDALAGSDVLELAQPTAYGPQVVTAGAVPTNPSELLSGATMQQVLRRLSSAFDLVIVDSPPLLPASESLALSRDADAVLLVVRAGRTTLQQVHECLSEVRRLDGSVLGLVLTGFGEHPTPYAEVGSIDASPR